MPNGFTEQDRDDFEHLKRDMWWGNGKKGVTTRLEMAEDRMDRLEEESRIRNRQFWAILILLVAAIISSSLDMAKHRDFDTPYHSQGW